MSQNSKDNTVTLNFQISIRTDEEELEYSCLQDFLELQKEWSNKVQITSATASVHDGREYESLWNYDEDQEKKD